MKGDFSRLRFNRARHYTSVLTQQGRVELDSDANEQRAIDEHLRKTETIDIVGQSGGPIDHAGFDIALNADQSSLTFSAGRYYVDGLLCENPAPGDYATQPYLLGATGIASMLTALRRGTLSALQVYLEVWQRVVTPIDDPGIKEVALGEADTTDRLQTVWRVVVEQVFAEGSSTTASAPAGSSINSSTFSRLGLTNRIANLNPALTTALTAASNRSSNLNAVTSRATSTSLIDSAAGLGSSGGAVGVSGPVGTQSATVQTQDGTSQDTTPALSCCQQMALASKPVTPGKMGVLTGSADTTASPCLPVPSAGYRGLENQLYRVEIHHGGTAEIATFKWSRDNGSVVTSVVSTSASSVNVDSLGPDANLGFSPTQWVELIDDSNEFGLVPNQPGQLRQIEGIDTTDLKVTFDANVDALPIDLDVVAGHAKLRRWDQFTPSASSDGVPLSAGNWIDLENGIQICFTTTGTYTAGDYWLIPARTATGNVEWPPADSDASRFQPPHQTTIHRAPLACIHITDRQFVVEPCRQLFYPLIDLTPAAAVPALHVTNINWPNDGIYTVAQLLQKGLLVTFDNAPSVALTSANFVVEANVPISALEKREFQSIWAGSLLFATPVLEISGTVAQQGSTPVFKWSPPLMPNVAWYYDLLQLAQSSLFVRIRVTLKGRFIFAPSGAQTLYLDGRALGQPGTALDGKTPRIDLVLPSGEGAQSSDFESWFTLVPPLEIESLTVATNTPAVAPAVGAGPITPLTEVGAAVRDALAPNASGAAATVAPSAAAAVAPGAAATVAPAAATTIASGAAPAAASSVAGNLATAAANVSKFTLANQPDAFTQIIDPVFRSTLTGESTTCQVTLQYPPLFDTTVQLSVSNAGGYEPYISLPSSVVVSAGTKSQTFVVRVIVIRELATNPPTIVASLTDSGGQTSTQSLVLKVG
ncbi:DUF6519 domain-containing protein [Paraburkholderia fynbosensis]|uniref:Uncharacterized protein n=1 Tax=Paraburkholderia fynbosensis TaxID=1200993 RepID=A0A6J5GI86_9BURK|nr:DUF6519 domain-containing protein [Paraburkholderia fynbosensis]CAB3801268.1 hypothetical protein LMG27177_05012 [Paraburkholderia fynbosensis]